VRKSDYLATGDKDFLSLPDNSPCPIIAAEQLLGMLKQRVSVCAPRGKFRR
jgi:hypothetical protein